MTTHRNFLHIAIGCALLAVANIPATAGAQGTGAPPSTAAAANTSTATSASEQIALGDRATSERQPRVALQHYELALQPEPRNYEALWKATGAAIDIGESEPEGKTRDALYLKATDFARRAIAIDSVGAEGQFSYARALGRTALSVGVRERVKYGTEIRDHAMKALAANPQHPGALHIMGVWNAEVMRLSGLTRLFARTFLGGKVFASASWADAIKYIDASVANDPKRAVHRLDQARIYRDAGRKADARAAYKASLECPLIDANDELYHRAAEEELRAMK